MDSVPVRRPVTAPYRGLTNFLERRIRLPDINPSWYQVAAILASLAILYLPSIWAQAAVLAFILLTDWLDGATARQHRGKSREGYIMDVTIDRASEVLIFAGAASTLAGKLFFALALLNIGLAYYSIRSGRHTSLPLRCAWLGVLLFAGGG